MHMHATQNALAIPWTAETGKSVSTLGIFEQGTNPRKTFARCAVSSRTSYSGYWSDNETGLVTNRGRLKTETCYSFLSEQRPFVRHQASFVFRPVGTHSLYFLTGFGIAKSGHRFSIVSAAQGIRCSRFVVNCCTIQERAYCAYWHSRLCTVTQRCTRFLA